MKTLTVAVACAGMALILTRAFPAEKKGDAAKGQAVFAQQCAVCHNADSTEKKMGPGLKGLYKKATLTDGKKVTDANVRAKIDAGGNGMPAFKEMLSDQEKDELLAYLKTL